MDVTENALREELERRLAVLETEQGQPHTQPLPTLDLVAGIVIVVVAVLIGLIVGLV